MWSLLLKTRYLSVETVIVPRKTEMGWAARLGIVRCSADSRDRKRNAGRNYRKTSLRRQQKESCRAFPVLNYYFTTNVLQLFASLTELRYKLYSIDSANYFAMNLGLSEMSERSNGTSNISMPGVL